MSWVVLPESGPKLEGVEAGVLEREAEPDGPAGERAQIGARPPSGRDGRSRCRSARPRHRRPNPGRGRPSASWISTRIPPPAEVAKFSTSSLPANRSGRVTISPPS